MSRVSRINVDPEIKNLGGRVLVSVLSVLFILSAIEAYLRIFKPVLGKAPPLFVYDRDLGFPRINHRAVPDTNSLGFHDLDSVPGEDPVSYRIVGIGDSFAWGVVPRSENYHTIVETRLNATLPPHKFEVINLGVPGYGPADELRLLKNYGISFKPNLVLLGFCMSNDFWDNRPGSETVVFNGELFHPAGWERLVPYLGYYFVSVWKPLAEGWKKSSESASRARAKEKPQGHADGEGAFSYDTFIGLEYKNSLLYRRDNLGSKQFRGEWANVRQALLGMKSVCDAHGAKFVVVLFPDQITIEQPVWEAVSTRYKLSRADYDFEAPANLLKALGMEMRTPVLDLSPAFAQVDGKGGYYAPRDIHWNQAGNELAAQAEGVPVSVGG